MYIDRIKPISPIIPIYDSTPGGTNDDPKDDENNSDDNKSFAEIYEECMKKEKEKEK